MLPSKGGWQIPIVPANKEEFKISHVQDRMTLPKQQQQKKNLKTYQTKYAALLLL